MRRRYSHRTGEKKQKQNKTKDKKRFFKRIKSLFLPLSFIPRTSIAASNQSGALEKKLYMKGND